MTMLRLPIVSLFVAWLLWTPPGRAATPDITAGKRIYDDVCAACHGPSGRLADDSPLRATMTPADFTDPLFNSREATRDWHMVVTHGGHAMGLPGQMPAQGQALTEQDVKNVVAYVKTLADTRNYPPGEFNFFLPIRTKKAFPEDEVVWKLRHTDRPGADAWRNVLEIEKRVGARGQFVLEGVHDDNGVSSRLSEVELGYKHVMGWDLARGWLLSGTMMVSLPTDGDESAALSPYLSFARHWNDRWIMQASARTTVPFDDAGDGALDLGAALHYKWTPWPRRIFPGIEFTAHAPFRSPAGDRVQYSVVPQLRFGLTRGGHVALNLGVEVPLSDQPWDRQYHAVLLWDFADGSFFMGW